MPEPRDRHEFGGALKRIRKEKGLTQQEVVDGLPGHYGDVSAYRRVENGARLPERDTAVAICVHGLKLTDVGSIETLLASAGYESMSQAELNALRLNAEFFPPPPEPVEPEQRPTAIEFPPQRWPQIAIPVSGVLASIALSAALCSYSEYAAWFGLAVSGMYAGLYSISLLLESAYQPQTRRLPVLAGVFSLMLVSSSIAFAADASLVNSGSGYGLAVALIIFGLAAALQAVLSRNALPNYTVVKARFLMHTAQSAHLKNTSYFLLIVVLFILPPLHAVTILRREARLGHVPFVREKIGHWMLLGHGMISLNYGWLIGLLIVIVIISLPMRTRLIDNLRLHPSQNPYLLLFYTRALVYFGLIITCVVWYAYAIGSLLDQLG